MQDYVCVCLCKYTNSNTEGDIATHRYKCAWAMFIWMHLLSL